MESVDLFVGAGGFALGGAKAGFKHHLVLDNDSAACRTLRANQHRDLAPFNDWTIRECDIRGYDFSEVPPDLSLLTGGPPCQPFSTGGRHRAFLDQRDLFSEAVRAVGRLAPKAFIFENVKGLIRHRFSDYFEYVRLRLCHPELSACEGESWMHHLSRLEEYETSGARHGLHYNVLHRVLNAADYGVPQKRERIFIVGFRCDLTADWHFPMPSHSREALFWSQREGGEYWKRHNLRAHEASPVSNIHKMLEETRSLQRLPWRTVRDAIGDLPDPERCEISSIANHIFRPGARCYKGHTGSVLDEPAKALKAGVHGTAGGENMLRKENGNVRYFTVREAARLQTFPDEMVFEGTWTQVMRQIGNAVPCLLAEAVVRSVGDALNSAAQPRQWRARSPY